jgi:hypothetical protein
MAGSHAQRWSDAQSKETAKAASACRVGTR